MIRDRRSNGPARLIVALLGASGAIIAWTGVAQVRELPDRTGDRLITVAVVAVDSIDHPSARAKVIRRGQDETVDVVIAVNPTATAADLARAVAAGAMTYDRYPTSLPTSELVAFIETYEPVGLERSGASLRQFAMSEVLAALPDPRSYEGDPLLSGGPPGATFRISPRQWVGGR
jgi:hypothetical protein